MSDYASAARSLALPIDSDSTSAHASTTPRSPSYTRSNHRRTQSRSSTDHASFKDRFLSQTTALQMRVQKTYSQLSLVQRILLGVGGLIALVLGILFLVFNERIFGALAPVAKRWRAVNGGWCILWLATFLVGFPPLIGYSSAVTLAGFVYGVWKGWLIVASATILGSTASFLVSRTLLHSFVTRRTAANAQFAALSAVLKQDGILILLMIRLCPLPYSLSNGAVATIPTVKWTNFLIATIIASPKLFLHVFVGSRLGAIAEEGATMDARTKAISYLSIAIGVSAGAATGWFMYTKTATRARELEAQEGGAGGPARASREGDEESGEYSDDPRDAEEAAMLRAEQDGFSMHTAAQEALDDDYAEEEEEQRLFDAARREREKKAELQRYRDRLSDEFADDGGHGVAPSLEDVFGDSDVDDLDASSDLGARADFRDSDEDEADMGRR